MRYSLWNLLAQSSADPLVERLESSGFALRQVDTAGVTSAEELWDRCGEAFDFDGGGWDSFADDMWMSLLPDDDEGDKVAFVWHHADELARDALAVFLDAFDVVVSIGRAAYAEQLQVITFALGDGPSFPAPDLDALIPAES